MTPDVYATLRTHERRGTLHASEYATRALLASGWIERTPNGTFTLTDTGRKAMSTYDSLGAP